MTRHSTAHNSRRKIINFTLHHPKKSQTSKLIDFKLSTLDEKFTAFSASIFGLFLIFCETICVAFYFSVYFTKLRFVHDLYETMYNFRHLPEQLEQRGTHFRCVRGVVLQTVQLQAQVFQHSFVLRSLAAHSFQLA